MKDIKEIGKIFLILLIVLIILAYIHELNMVLGMIIMGILSIYIIFHLIKRRNNSNEFFKKYKWWIIIALLVVNLLDTTSTYSFMLRDNSPEQEMSVIAKGIVYLFGINIISMIAVFLIFSLVCIYLVKVVSDDMAKKVFFVLLGLKILLSIINLRGG